MVEVKDQKVKDLWREDYDLHIVYENGEHWVFKNAHTISYRREDIKPGILVEERIS